MLVIIAGALTAQIGMVLAVSIQIVSVVAVICFLVYFMICWALSGIACVLEGKRPVAALRRSRELIKDYVNPVVGEYCLFIVTLLLASIPYMIVLYMLGEPADGTEAEIFIGAINNIIINSILVHCDISF
ncbi:MAG: hypothetical protein JXL82_05310 [Candidatus Omnitrophica bacterium]|nr:hypothetical protein [Candidatus Omnitrophota bacterium]